MTDENSIICPHCREKIHVMCEYVETTEGTCQLIMNHNEPLVDASGVTFDGFKDNGNEDLDITRYYCDNCGHDLTEDEIIIGRNNYLAAATKEET